MKKQHIFKSKEVFKLESGKILPEIEIVYHTYGQINEDASNVHWICHALTANSDPQDWWTGMIGEGCMFDPTHDFIICANVLGSCYGSTGPLSINPKTGGHYFLDFPEITVRDMVAAHELLRASLGIRHLKSVAGASIGAFQSIEWAVSNPDLMDNLFFVGSGAKVTPWAIAWNETQRMAIESDPTYAECTPKGGEDGMKAARAMALISYRGYEAYNATQQDKEENVIFKHRVNTYQRYQGQKLADRFNAYSYYRLSQSIDSHDIGRGRGGVIQALQSIKANAVIVGISTDILFPICEQKFVADHIRKSYFEVIESDYGHDGFLLEYEKLSRIFRQNMI